MQTKAGKGYGLLESIKCTGKSMLRGMKGEGQNEADCDRYGEKGL